MRRIQICFLEGHQTYLIFDTNTTIMSVEKISVMWRFFWFINRSTYVEFMLFCCKICVLSRFTHFSVENNLIKNCVCGEKIYKWGMPPGMPPGCHLVAHSDNCDMSFNFLSSFSSFVSLLASFLVYVVLLLLLLKGAHVNIKSCCFNTLR